MAFLYARIDYERAISIPYTKRAFRLDRMRELLDRLGNPQDRLRIIHVAGTKGKGSTSAMIATVLSAAGYRTGLFTSPHLERLEERMMIDGAACSGEELIALVDAVRPAVQQMDDELGRRTPPEPGVTYFEATTAMALLHFANTRTDAAVLEVGLGGRLDSTNVCAPQVCAITSISFDHTKQLGNTLAEIAGEKAGIIKPGVPVVSGVIEAEPQRVIADVAQRRAAPLVQLGVDFTFGYRPPRGLDDPAAALCGIIDFEHRSAGREQQLHDVDLGLLGRHQAANAAVALAVLAELRAAGWRVPESTLRRGLADVKWPARVEIVARQPAVVIDAAHNVASVQSLLDTLNESFNARRRILIFGTTLEKDTRGMLCMLLPQFETTIVTQYLTNPRAVPLDELKAEADAVAAELNMEPPITSPDPASAWNLAQRSATPEDLICVTGSFFLAAEMRAEIGRSLAPVYPSRSA